MRKVTYRQIVVALTPKPGTTTSSLDEVMRAKKLPVQKRMALAKLSKALREEQKLFNDERTKIIREAQEEDPKTGELRISATANQQLEDDINGLLATEVDLSSQGVTERIDLPEKTMESAELIADLGPFIKVEGQEDEYDNDGEAA